MFTLFVLIGSYFFWSLVGRYEQFSLMYMRVNSPEMMNRLNFQDAIFGPLFGNLAVILIFLIPLLTMRLIAEEKSSRTIELLYTSPLAPREIVFGKFLGALFVVTCALLLTLIYPGIVQLIARDTAGVEWRTVLLGYLGSGCSEQPTSRSACSSARSPTARRSQPCSGSCSPCSPGSSGGPRGRRKERRANRLVPRSNGSLEAFGRGTWS